MNRKTMDGITLGIYQAHAYAGPPCGIILIAMGHIFLGLFILAGASLAWYGWGRHFNYRRRP